MDFSAHEGEIPIPISSTYVGQSHGHGHGHSLIHDTTPQLHHHNQQHHHNYSNGPPPPLTTVPTTDNNIKKGSSVVVKYRECLKNHAAAIGGNATDGCGEFMSSGEEGSLEAMKCSACGCHRNFHRKETEGDNNNNNTSSCECSHYHHHHLKGGGGRKLIGGHKGVLISSGPDAAFGYYSNNNNSLIPRPTPHSMIMPIGAAAIQTSESDEMEGVGGGYPRPPMLKKRFRTKFSAEQKEKMLAFAEKAGWKLQKQEESVVQQLCQEIGVKRRVLKVWMHNNKHNLAKKAYLPMPSSLNERMNG